MDDDNVGLSMVTVNVLLVLVEDAYGNDSAWVAINVTVPSPTRVIQFPEASMVATAVLLLLYVIAPLLLLVGRVTMLNGTSPPILVDGTEKVVDERVDAYKTVNVLLDLVADVYRDVAA